MPPLHAWSLAIEEQYDIVFSIFALLDWRFGFRAMLSMIISILVISLALSEWGWRNHSTSNFFPDSTSAWEILEGSVCAFILFKKEQIPTNQTGSLIGVAAIISSVVLFSYQTPFPSLYTLLTVVQAVLLILFYASSTFIGKFLASKTMVFLGLISYSLYLWHQLILAFYQIRFMMQISVKVVDVFSGPLVPAWRA